MAIDIDIYTLTYSKSDIDTKISDEETRADAAIALKLDSSEVGQENGVAPLTGGLIDSANVDWADNAEALAGSASDKVMSPLRVKEAHNYYLSDVGGVTQVSTSVPQSNTLNIAFSKVDFFDTNCVSAGSHFTIDAVNQQITVNTTGIYKISGMFAVEAALAAEICFMPYKNGAQFSPHMHITALGVGNPVGWHYNMMCTLTAGDIITVWGNAEVDSTAVSITSSAFGMEKVIHG